MMSHITTCITLAIIVVFQQSFAEDMKYPSGWNKTIDDLIEENRELSWEEIEYARNYEKDLLPNDTRFPKNNDIYESIEDVEITYTTHWRAPASGGEKFVLRKGIAIKVEVDDNDLEPIGVYAKPLEYKKYEEEIIPVEDRVHPKYSGYGLYIDTKILNEKFKLNNT
jgi:hypothetical protein